MNYIYVKALSFPNKVLSLPSLLTCQVFTFDNLQDNKYLECPSLTTITAISSEKSGNDIYGLILVILETINRQKSR